MKKMTAFTVVLISIISGLVVFDISNKNTIYAMFYPHSTEVDSAGVHRWRMNGMLHREDGAAIVHPLPTDKNVIGSVFINAEEWFINGLRHRVDGPAQECTMGSVVFFDTNIEIDDDLFNNPVKYKKSMARLVEINHHREGNSLRASPCLSVRYWDINIGDSVMEHPDGTKEWYTDGVLRRDIDRSWWLNGLRHRVDGPAVEDGAGDRFWWLNGKKHREVGPAEEWANGDKFWYLNGKLHRMDGPAAVYANGSTYWYLHGKRHREDGPAAVRPHDDNPYWWMQPSADGIAAPANGGNSWWLNGLRHREGGPAIALTNGEAQWYLNGMLHREDGPAQTFSDGSEFWFWKGQRHREDGPAVKMADGSEFWWVHGTEIKQ